MAILAVLTAINDHGASDAIVYSALALATAWTGMTVWAAGKSDQLGSVWFVLADIVVALLVAAASTGSGAAELFHGGYPMSTLAVTAYAFNLPAAVGAALLLSIEQVTVHIIDARGGIPAVGSVVFIVFAILLGWTMDRLREGEQHRIAVQEELDREVAARVRHQERLDLANRLHDSVLQTLEALRRDADDPDRVRYLARRQERQLRSTISAYRSPYAHSVRAGVRAICDEVEDLYRVDIDAVVRGDAVLDAPREALLASAREAIINAAKHSGSDSVDVYAELDAARVHLFVRDRGCGMNPAAASSGGGLDHGIRKRAEEVGAVVNVTSVPGAGTEVEILWEAT